MTLCSSILRATFAMASMVRALKNQFAQHATHFYFLKIWVIRKLLLFSVR